MEHHNPLLANLKSHHKFITIGEIMLRLTPPNYQKIRMANEFEAKIKEFQEAYIKAYPDGKYVRGMDIISIKVFYIG